MGAPDSPPRRRRRLVLVLAVVAAVVAVVVGVGLAGGSSSGTADAASDPTAAPDPRAYVSEALDIMEFGGYHVDPARWPAVRAEAERLAATAPDTVSTYPALRSALVAAGGEHSELLDPGTGVAPVDAEPAVPSLVTAPDGISTVSVPTLDTGDPQALQRYADTLAAGLTRAAGSTSCGWIVDLRGNEGGNMWPMLAGLSPLLPDGPQLSFASNVGQRSTVLIDGGSARIAEEPQARVADAPKSTKPIAVLQDRGTASSGEALLLAFRDRPNVRTIGSDSAGLSTANMSVPLSDGATMVLTTAVYVDRTGTPHGDEIEPDQQAADALAAADRWLRDQCGR